ncbi:Retrotransposon gag protein [Gossypium australe]|uniref:Retrotransposon gag protein n=1 Tax=Gossypium australe TaxID=47621 RepID=A0A5B6W2Q8_9ROSI|nr:Retrotransposon gag protein [Gossypium australe]
MENGHDGKLAGKLSGLALNDKEPFNDDSLFQVMKAVEAAEATIKQQAEENNRLRSELQKKIEQLEKYKVDGGSNPNASADKAANTDFNGTFTAPASSSSDNNKGLPISFPSSPLSAVSFPPTRRQLDGEYDSTLPQGLMPIPKVNSSNSLWKQDVTLKVREQEEEILQLRKQLAEFSVKEAQIRNEKYVLEKRISYMRLAFDQQQQDLVDAASKALSYRQDIIEENIRLAYQLQAAQQERTTFISSLLPLLTEYSLQPPVPDAQSIVSNVKVSLLMHSNCINGFSLIQSVLLQNPYQLAVKLGCSLYFISPPQILKWSLLVLFKHLQEKLIVIESKLKESQYQLAPWRSDVNHSNFAPQSPLHSLGATLPTSSKNGLELVPQPTYSLGKTQLLSGAPKDFKWDLPSQQQGGLGGGVASKKLEPDDLGRYSPIASSCCSMINTLIS